MTLLFSMNRNSLSITAVLWAQVSSRTQQQQPFLPVPTRDHHPFLPQPTRQRNLRSTRKQTFRTSLTFLQFWADAHRQSHHHFLKKLSLKKLSVLEKSKLSSELQTQVYFIYNCLNNEVCFQHENLE